MKILSRTLLIAALCAIVPAVYGEDILPVFDIPACRDIVLDANDADWKDQGFDLDIIPIYAGRQPDAADYNISARIGWDSRGIVALFKVTDNNLLQPRTADELVQARADCVTIDVINQTPSKMVEACIAPPMGADPESLFTVALAMAEDRTINQMSITSAGRMIAGGYLVETLVPWGALGLNNAPSSGIRLQVLGTDRDSYDTEPIRAAWFPYFATLENPDMSYRVTLGTNASPRRLAATAWRYAAEPGMMDNLMLQRLLGIAAQRWPEENVRLKQEWALYLSKKNPEAALQAFLETADLAKTNGDTFHRADAIFRAGLLENSTENKLLRLREALDLVRKEDGFKYRYLENRLLLGLGILTVASSPESEDGEKILKEAYDLAKAQTFTEFYPQIEGALGRHALAKGDSATARQHFQKMLDLSDWETERAYAWHMIDTADNTPH